MKAQGVEPVLPALSPVLFENPHMPIGLPVMVEWLMEMGPTEPAGMGMATISWATIGYWEKATGVELNPWQAKLMRRLSGDWFRQSEEARKMDCPAPYQSRESVQANRKAVNDGMLRAFGAFGPRGRAIRG
jgi:hypothetical protein